MSNSFIKNTPIFEQSYIEIRSKESRVYSDKEVVLLPLLPKSHPQRKEWLLRNDTLIRFEKYLSSVDNNSKNVLDIGCGNGWFSNRMALLGLNVLGVDINQTELTQANRLFKKDNLSFMYANVFDQHFVKKFDFITFNASIQYFEDVPVLMNSLCNLLTKNGEIHILDSPIYNTNEEALMAKKRSQDYFAQMNSSSMSSFYFHHTKFEFDDFEFLYRKKRSILSKVKNKNASPFPWLRWTY